MNFSTSRPYGSDETRGRLRVVDVSVLAVLPYYLSLGAVVGLLAGLLGIGGGLIIVPGLLWIFSTQAVTDARQIHLAVGTSLAVILLTAMASVRGHQRQGAVLWPVVLGLTPGLFISGIGGALFAGQLSSRVLTLIFAIFALLVALVMVLDLRPRASRHLPPRSGLTLTGLGIGALSTLVGIGGGSLTTPYLLWCNISLRQAIATSAACGLPIACAGAGTYLLTGLDAPGLPPGSSGYIYWPAVVGIAASSMLLAPLGASLTHRLSVYWLKKAFALLLIVVALRLLVSA